MELLHIKIFDLLLEPDLDFLKFPKHETGWGVRYPGQGIFTPTCILDIKQLFYGTIPKHKTGWGIRYPGQGIFTPTLYYWHAMRYVT